jgi:hypothetical protein
MSNDLESIWKELVVVYFIAAYKPSIFLEELRNTTNAIRYDSLLSYSDSSPGPPDYGAGIMTKGNWDVRPQVRKLA